MRKSRIFVSSTCYDLGPVRESVRELITHMGHEPVLSEYPSFPVDPLASTVSNCRRNVINNTDIFVLLIGDTYGSVDLKSGKSITNLEFESAISEGLPTFIFIKKNIITLLPIWEENENVSIRGVPDNRVFAFVKSVRSRGLWTYSFERVEEIKIILSEQLSVMFRDLLERRTAGKLDPLLSFRGESTAIRSLVLDKPKYWEYLLSADLFRNRLSKTMRRYKRLQQGFSHVPLKTVSGPDFFAWIQDYFSNLMSIIDILGKEFVITFKESLGPLGVPGDPESILAAVNEIDSLLNQLVDYERDLISHRPPELFRDLQNTATGVVDVVFQVFESLPERLVAPFQNGDPPDGAVFEITLVFPSPDLSGYEAELDKLEQILSVDPSVAQR